MKLWRAATLALVLGLAGCGSDGSSEAKGDSGTAVTTVTLRNGVVCRVMDGDGVSLVCDWRGPRGSQPVNDPKGDSGTAISTVTLRNGVTCAGMLSRQGEGQHKALTCDWHGPRGPQSAKDPTIDGTAVTLATLPDSTTCAVMDGPGKALSCATA